MFKSSPVAVAVMLGSLSLGCNTYQPLQFSVRDAETGEPIPRATIDVHYHYVLDPFHPNATSNLADGQGNAIVKVATKYSGSVATSAEGYIPESEQLLRVKSESPRQEWLYRMPRPTVEIVVPDGYRGLLSITIEPTESRIQDVPGQRHFVFHASDTGNVHIKATPLLSDWSRWFSRLPVSYENGRKIPDRDDHDVAEQHVAARFIGGGGQDQLRYVIGTSEDVIRAKENDTPWCK